jgi:ABC-type iron transport system FetAB permease component
LKFVYEYILSVLSIHDNLLVGIILLGIIDLIAYKLAYSVANNSIEHWSIRICILLALSTIVIINVNIIKWL